MDAQVCAAGTGLLQKLGRVLKEKAQGDLDRVFKGTSKTRQKLGVKKVYCLGFCSRTSGCYICHTVTHVCSCMLLQVVEELFTYWSLEDADDTLEELEEALIVSSSWSGQTRVRKLTAVGWALSILGHHDFTGTPPVCTHPYGAT